ncbi:flavodoxin family protein [Nocardioides lacusdianchii]|uniref:flavodoxin family protein n=1 Tax=Nocardioides lacusdianchii TaxID=2783664 RepID=UPI001CCE9014|nr:flavodoxin domain-containing protein [Nocardioides lacusdianchii]
MTTLVVHESMFGNTRAIAEAIAADLPGHVEVVDVTDAPTPLPAHVDLLVVGGPTHAFSMSRAGTRRDAVGQGAAHEHEVRGIREWLGGLPRTPHVAVAAFDTRVTKVRRLPGSAARAAGKVIARRGLGRVVAVESFYVEDVSGPLLEGEVERARAWARSLVPAAHPR